VIQLWINSPAAKKMIPPEYQYLSNESMPTFLSNDGKVTNKLVAGQYLEQRGKITPQSELLVIWSEGSADGQITLAIPEGFNSMLYVVRGQLSLKGHGIVDGEELATLSTEGSEIELAIKEDGTQFILLAGKPINEKVAQQGPYVMNNTTELLEAMRDYQMGKMGILIED
jgi:redox-sensitive bicupin YhaK (pirin superfamily)